MTEKEKARAYDKALVRASKLRVQNPFDTVSQMMEHVFPELAESEDERMKKAIIHILYENYTDAAVIEGVEIAEIVAWLEKQGESKFYSWKPTKEQYEALDYAYNSCSDTERGNYYEGVLETLIEDLHRLEKQGQKPMWTDEDEKRLQSCIVELQGKGLMGGVDTIDTKWLKSLKQRDAALIAWVYAGLPIRINMNK